MGSEISSNVYEQIRATVLTAKNKVYTAVNSAMVEAYWSIGKQIADAQGERAEYGKQLLKYLSEQRDAVKGEIQSLEQGLLDNLQELLLELGKGFSFVARQKRITIVLCSDKNDTMVKYSVLSENDRLFASKYMLYMPTEDELKKELERERRAIESTMEPDERHEE